MTRSPAHSPARPTVARPSLVEALDALGQVPWSTVQEFLDWAEGYDPRAVSPSGDTVLMRLARLAAADQIDLLATALPWCDPAATNHSGMSAWLYAAAQGWPKALDLLAPHLDDAAKTRTDENGWTALHHAANSAKSPAALRSLLHHGMAVDQPASTIGHATALMFAASEETTHAQQAVEVLLCAGAVVDRPDDYGCTALHWASSAGTVASMQRLINAGANVHHVNHQQETLLMAAMSNPFQAGAKLDLLLPRIDPNARDINGQTALDQAIRCVLLDEADVLVRAMRPDLVISVLRPRLGQPPRVDAWFRDAMLREQAALREALDSHPVPRDTVVVRSRL